MSRIERVYGSLSPAVWLALIVVFGALLRISLASYLWGTDDLNYSNVAWIESNDLFGPLPEAFTHNHHSLRKGLIFPVAILYKLFGVNDFTTGIIPLICSLGLIVLAHRFGRLFLKSEPAALLCALLYACYPMSIIFGFVLWPTEPQTFVVSLGMYWFFREDMRAQAGEDKPWRWLMSGLILGYAWLIHLTSMFVGLFFVAWIIVYRKRFRWPVLLVGVGVVLVVAAEAVGHYMVQGTWLYRLTQMDASQNAGLGFGFIINWEGTSQLIEGTALASFWVGPWSMSFLNQEYALYCLVGFPMMIWAAIKAPKLRPVILWFALVWFWTAYGTTTPARWQWLGRMPRYYAPVSIPMILALGWGLTWLWQQGRLRLAGLVALGVLGSGVAGAAIDDGTNSWFEKQIVEKMRAHPDKVVGMNHHPYSVALYYSGYADVLPNARLVTQPPPNSYIYKDAKVVLFKDAGADPLAGMDAFFYLPESWELSIGQPENCGSEDKMGRLTKDCVAKAEQVLKAAAAWGEPEVIKSKPRRWLCGPVGALGLSLPGPLASLCKAREAYWYVRP